MKPWIAGAAVLAAVGTMAGCAPMPEMASVEVQSERMLHIGTPFTYSIEGEPIDAGDAPASLTLEHCVRLALEHDPRIQSALARLRQAEADARQTRLLPNPVIGVAIRFPEGGGKSIIDADLSAELLSLLTLPGRISAADGRLRKAGSQALATVLDVVLDVQRQYAQVQTLRGRIDIEESRHGILGQIAGVTDARVKAGEATRFDALTSRAALASLEAELIALRSEERLACLTLARLIGQPSSPADWAITPWAVPALADLPEATWIALALEHRPEISAVRWELAALGQEVRLAKLEPWTGGAGLAAERDGAWSVGPSASVVIPIFDTGETARQRRLAMVAEQQHELTRVSRHIVEDVRRSLAEARTADEALERTRRELIPIQEQRLKQAQDAYRLGLADIIALRTAEQEMQDTRSRVVQLEYQQLQARFNLDRAIGGPGAYAVPATQPVALSSENHP